MNIKLIICYHKEYFIPHNDYYIPIHVGKELSNKKLNMIGDNTGENISVKNRNYCELTGMYWAWKNLECDIIGICHYRRYFDFNNNKIDSLYKKIDSIQNNKNSTIIKDIFNEGYDIILPEFTIHGEKIANHYINDHIEEDWNILITIIKQEDSLITDEDIKEVFYTPSHRIFLCNMLIMNKKQYDIYCGWLFNILSEVEKKIVINKDSYQARVFGFMSERLLNLYVYKKKLKIKMCNTIFL